MALNVDHVFINAKKKLKKGSISEAENEVNFLLSKFPKNLRFLELKKKIKKVKSEINISNKIVSQGDITKRSLANETSKYLLKLFKNEEYKNLLNEIPSILEQNPKEFILWYLLGLTFAKLNNFEDAISNLKEALKLKKHNHEIYNHIGLCYKLIGKFDTALKYYENGLSLKKDDFSLNNNLANLIKDKNDFSYALELYNRCLGLDKDKEWGIYYNIGQVYLNQNNLDKAIENFQISIEKNPRHADTYNDLGNVYQKLGKSDVAQNFYKKAIFLQKNHKNAYHNLADSQRISNKLEEGLENYNKAISLNPHSEYLLGSSIFLKMKLCLWDDFESSITQLIEGINDGKKVSTPFPIQSLIDNPAIQQKNNEYFSKENYPKKTKYFESNYLERNDKIRVGYFSPDFCNHPIAFLTAELYETHNRDKFEIYAFSFGRDNNDEFNLRVKAGVDKYLNVGKLSDEEVVKLVRSLKIDIAIDLAGYTKGQRSNIFAMAAAPIQIGYAGFLGTMGNNYHDYLISDKIIIPRRNKKFYNEKIIFLPTYQVNLSYKNIETSNLNRNFFGLPSEGFVFGCFNNSYKISPKIFNSWTRILHNTKNSVLFLVENNQMTKNNLKKEIERKGINPDRLIFGEHLPRSDYLLRYQAIDLFLDTLPYNGGTTTSDALRMGTPVLTCKGNSFPSRLAASILNSIDLPELIVKTQQEYIDLATDLAINEIKFKNIKNKLYKNLSHSNLYNIEAFTQSLEKAFIEAYNKKINGQKPDHIYIE